MRLGSSVIEILACVPSLHSRLMRLGSPVIEILARATSMQSRLGSSVIEILACVYIYIYKRSIEVWTGSGCAVILGMSARG